MEPPTQQTEEEATQQRMQPTGTTELDLSDGRIGSSDELQRVLEDHPALTHLNLSDNPAIGDIGCAVLSFALLSTNTSLRVLELRKCGISAAGTRALSDALSRNNGLECWDFSVAPASTTLAIRCALEHLDLSANEAIDDDGCEALARALNTNNSLSALHLRKCGIGPAGVRALAKALVDNNALQRLEVDAVRGAERELKSIAQVLERNRLRLQGSQS